MSVEVWLAQDGEPHQARVQSTFQAYMRALQFYTGHAVKEGINHHNYRNCGDGLPLCIDRDGYLKRFEGSFFVVINNAVLQQWCHHECSDSLHAHDIALDELQHSSCCCDVLWHLFHPECVACRS